MIKPALSLVALALACASASAAGVRFVVVDASGKPVKDGAVLVGDPASLLPSLPVASGSTVDLETLAVTDAAPERTVTLRLGQTITLQQQNPPVKDIYITVTATRLKRPTNDTSNGTTRTKDEINKFGGAPGGDVKNVAKSTAGVAEDSAGQLHVRGEHTEISYVVDGVPLPDTLSGRQGAIVVPSTIQSVDILLGGFAPEYGGQTAAILDITTLPRAKKPSSDLDFDYGTFDTTNGNFTAVGPIGQKMGYVVNLAGNRTKAVEEPQQPDIQTAHNSGSDANGFAKFTYQASPRDRIAFTASVNPDQSQIGNRTGLPDTFASAGEGYGFLGMRNRDGSRPDSVNGGLGSETIPLNSQQQDGMDINQREQNEFMTLSWRRQIDEKTVSQFGFVLLHSGQDVTNNNPGVDVTNLPVDNSIEYNPSAFKNIHHVQLNGSLAQVRGKHTLKAGFLLDMQSGNESYQIVPASQLALDALEASAPNLAPPGHFTGATDVNGNPVYVADSNNSPTLRVKREGHYYAAYMQDTWRPTKRLTFNYGLRGDWFRQSQNLGQPTVDRFTLSPRLNFGYELGHNTLLHASYDRLFNTPPLAQGAIIGEPLQPPIVDQFDLAIEKQIDKYQSVKLAYYYKQIQNQIDVGLLIPGSEIGLYTGVNLQHGGVHGLEFSYDIAAPKNVGWDAYFNYTLSAAKPKGVDNTGEQVDQFNDHDQRHTVGIGLAYTLKNGASMAGTFSYGSGLASSIVPPSDSRTPRTQLDLSINSGDKLFHGLGGVGVQVFNVFDSRQVINFQSAFSGTRFQQGRRVLVSAFFKF
ncbi:MAG TPA: TonB-dependent receptor [Fimbriimonadaceae bacterium]|nr:TonB-dependent receptor [Fimbriimonadaceae bacterium]